ncbi:MAG: bifunctional enoyl-CoA hydratase/phosphate acetyltransferase [Pseudomonadota bacterium]
MAIKNFCEMLDEVKKMETKKVAIAVAEDAEVLAAIRQAQDEGLAIGILTGDENNIKSAAEGANISLDGFEIIHEPDHSKAARLCCELIRKGEASAIMKGSLGTADYMKAILDKENGLNTGNLISHVAVFEAPAYPKLLFVTDAAINIRPEVEDKVKIINNTVSVAHKFGIDLPLVAACCAVEKVNPKMIETLHADELTKLSKEGKIEGCIVEGPFGLDIAISEESKRIKKIDSEVAGQADIILSGSIESGNYLYKSLAFFAQAKIGAIVSGAMAPIILTSRADTHETKFYSIVLGILSS